MTYLATTLHKNPCPGDHEIDNFGGPFLGHYYYTVSFSGHCLGIEKKILKEIMHFHYMTCMAMLQHKNPCPEGHEIYNFGRPFFDYHYYTISLSEPMPLGREDVLRNTSILHF